MKVFICLLVSLTACNATFFSGGGKSVTYDVIARPSLGHGHGSGSYGHGHGHIESYGHGHGHEHVQSYGISDGHSHGHSHGFSHGNSHSFEPAPQLIKVIVEEAHGHGHGHGHSGGADIHSYGSSYGTRYGSVPHGGAYQVIHESAPISHSGGGHAEYAVLDGGHSYGSGYSHHGSHGSGADSAQLNSILPQILQIIEQDGGYGYGSGGYGIGGSSAHYGQLIDAFGHHGTAIVTPSKKGQNSYFNSGHVIEKGVLEVVSQGKHGAGGGHGGANFGGTGLGDLLSRLSNGKGGSGGHGGSGQSSVKSGW